jgi:hypothetical protein
MQLCSRACARGPATIAAFSSLEYPKSDRLVVAGGWFACGANRRKPVRVAAGKFLQPGFSSARRRVEALDLDAFAAGAGDDEPRDFIALFHDLDVWA